MHSLSALNAMIASQRIKQLSNTVDGHGKSIEELREENDQLNRVIHSLSNALTKALARVEALINQARQADNLFLNLGFLLGAAILHKLLFIHDIISVLMSALTHLIASITNRRVRSGKRIQAVLDILTILGIYHVVKKRLIGMRW